MSTAQRHLISLGSSFAAGPGISPLSDSSAGRSAVNYPALVAARLGFRHTDLTVSGATLLNVLTDAQIGWFSRFEPQIEGVTSDADIVTLTGGGNDFGYIGGMMRDGLANSGFLHRMIGRIVMGAAPEEVPTEDEVVKRMVQVIEAVHARAPKATLLLIEYLAVIGDDTQPHSSGAPFPQARLNYYRQQAQMLQRIYKRAAEGKDWVRLVSAHSSLAHGLGSSEPWVTGLSLGFLTGGEVPFHPTREGMVALADMVLRDLQTAGLA